MHGTCLWFVKFVHDPAEVQNLILALTAIIGLWTVWSSGYQERRRTTVDLVLESFTQTELIQARQSFNKLVRNGLDIPYLLSEAGSNDRLVIFTIANRYEFIAIGIERKAFDAKVYKQLHYSSLTRDWDKIAEFVDKFRTAYHRPSAYQAFQILAAEWKKKPLRIDPRLTQLQAQIQIASAKAPPAGTPPSSKPTPPDAAQ